MIIIIHNNVVMLQLDGNGNCIDNEEDNGDNDNNNCDNDVDNHHPC